MGINASIYNLARPSAVPSLSKSIDTGAQYADQMRRKQVFDQTQAEQEAIKSAFAENPNDRGAAIKQIAGINPMKALEIEDKFRASESAGFDFDKKKLDERLNQTQRGLNLAMSAKDEQSYQKMLENIKGMGMDISHMPPSYDPDLMKRYASGLLTQKERLEAKKAEFNEMDANRNYGLNKRRVALAERQANQPSVSKDPFVKQERQDLAKEYSSTQKAGRNAQATIDGIDNMIGALTDYSRSSIGGTGVLAAARLWAGGDLAPETQALDRMFKSNALDDMKRIFAGMSKAIDSDAERKFFLESRPSIGNDETVNMKLLMGAKSAALKVKAEAEAQKRFRAAGGDMASYESPVNDMTTVVAQNGQMELIPKSQLENAIQSGMMTVDQFTDYALYSDQAGQNQSFRSRGAGLGSAVASDQPSRPPVIQNGIRYEWNPQTGKYE